MTRRVPPVMTSSIHFNPHSPCGERPQRDGLCMRSVCDFNPHSPCGERHVYAFVPEGRIGISIHTPLAGSDRRAVSLARSFRYFNPHSPCGERLHDLAVGIDVVCISIHTPLAGSDATPVGEPQYRPQFQSTLPLRGATWKREKRMMKRSYFNPHSPCGERQSSIWV